MISSILAQIGYEVARTQHLSRSASSNSSSCSVWERESSILTRIGCEVACTQHLSCSASNSICSIRLATAGYSSILAQIGYEVACALSCRASSSSCSVQQWRLQQHPRPDCLRGRTNAVSIVYRQLLQKARSDSGASCGGTGSSSCSDPS